jgi:hypothetical protein
MIIEFKNRNGTNITTRTIDECAPAGGNALSSANQTIVNQSFSSAQLWQIRLRVGTLSGGNFVNVINRIYPFVGSVGTVSLTPTDPSVAVHELLDYAFTWTVPEPLNWHDLESLQLRIRDDRKTILWVHFDEASNTFSLCNKKTGRCTRDFAPGSSNRLRTPYATLYLADTSVVGSGPTGPSVTLHIPLSFKPLAAGRTFVVEVAASDDDGNEDPFVQVGTLTVTWR